ncbi:hypothetical protein PAEPH01_2031 [Pancytospora epiphaga]|nr:hypothetical protein PAEPH01_2031 [Pancytospora epiphaga]
MPVRGVAKEVALEVNFKRYKNDFVVVDELGKKVISGKGFLHDNNISLQFGSPGSARVQNTRYSHPIETGTHEPISFYHYRISPQLDEIVRKKIEKLLSEGIIRPSISPWSSPIVMIPKDGTDWRTCVDYRKINEITIKDSYPMPSVEEILDSLSGSTIFSKLDCELEYHRIDMNLRDTPKTAFICKESMFEYLKMPFGLKNAPATFQRYIDRALGKCR